MGFFDKLFGKKEVTSVEKVIPQAPQAPQAQVVKNTDVVESVNDIPDVAVLSYGNGTFKIPVDGLRQGLKRYGLVKAYCVKTGNFIQLADLGEELLIFDPKDGKTIPFTQCTNSEFDDIKRAIYGGC